MQRRILVVGTRQASLGDAIASSLRRKDQFVMRADLPAEAMTGGNGAYACDITHESDVRMMLEDLRPTDVVCCVGLNLDDRSLWINMVLQMEVNCFGPVLLLHQTLQYWDSKISVLKGADPDEQFEPVTGLNFVAISSNSAHIARSQSAGYCASKAALSMALRCIARNHGGRDGYNIWGYEPGWINSTLMSYETEARLRAEGPPDASLHRIPGGNGLDKWALADGIAHDLVHVHHAFNGCMFRIDGGEQ